MVGVMNGQHISGTPIVVDYWRIKDLPPRMLFFLTHMHADHTSGLSSSWPYPIHCTSLTGVLLRRKFNINPKLVVELQLNEPTLLHVTTPYSNEHVNITVTAIDANHCPGSAMFIFEGYFGRILYTGDFRYSPSMDINPYLNNARFDILYLDNTYCDSSCSFPTREEATDLILTIIRCNPNRVIYLGLHTLGKENLLVHIATSICSRIGVDHERLEVLKLLRLPDVFDTDMDMCSIRVYPFHSLAKNYVKEVVDGDALGILPSALYVGDGAIPRPTHCKVIPYSDHSSYMELRDFVKNVRPRSVRPIVQTFTGQAGYIRSKRNNMAIFNDLLDDAPPISYSIPAPVLGLLSTKSVPLHQSTLPHRRKRSCCFTMGIPRSRVKGIQYLSPHKKEVKQNVANSCLDVSQNSDSGVDTDVKLALSDSDDYVTDNRHASCSSLTPMNSHQVETNITPTSLCGPSTTLHMYSVLSSVQHRASSGTVDGSLPPIDPPLVRLPVGAHPVQSNMTPSLCTMDQSAIRHGHSESSTTQHKTAHSEGTLMQADSIPRGDSTTPRNTLPESNLSSYLAEMECNYSKEVSISHNGSKKEFNIPEWSLVNDSCARTIPFNQLQLNRLKFVEGIRKISPNEVLDKKSFPNKGVYSPVLLDKKESSADDVTVVSGEGVLPLGDKRSLNATFPSNNLQTLQNYQKKDNSSNTSRKTSDNYLSVRGTKNIDLMISQMQLELLDCDVTSCLSLNIQSPLPTPNTGTRNICISTSSLSKPVPSNNIQLGGVSYTSVLSDQEKSLANVKKMKLSTPNGEIMSHVSVRGSSIEQGPKRNRKLPSFMVSSTKPASSSIAQSSSTAIAMTMTDLNKPKINDSGNKAQHSVTMAIGGSKVNSGEVIKPIIDWAINKISSDRGVSRDDLLAKTLAMKCTCPLCQMGLAFLCNLNK